jgi:hypothetical protein
VCFKNVFKTELGKNIQLSSKMNTLKTLAVDIIRAQFTPRRFGAFFGVTLETAGKLWHQIRLQNTVQPKHLLWTLYFLKQNPSELVNHIDAAPKTWLKYVRLTLTKSSNRRRS